MVEKGFEAQLNIKLNGGNTRVQKDEIEAIFNSARDKAKELNITAEMEFMVR